jgi:molecular chaperone DnaK
MSDVILGIDLGTTNSAVGVMDTGFPVLIPDANGERLTPSVVDWRQNDLEGVGLAGKRVRAAFPESTFYSTKRLIGRRYRELGVEELDDIPFQVGEDPEGWAAIRFGESWIRPEEVASRVLRKLKADAEAYLDEKANRAVISVPAYFNEGQRQATRAAAEKAGLKVERMISEPTAAALAYGVDAEFKDARLAVFDLGGGTFDVSLLHLSGGVFEVIATHGNTRLGGDDIDRLLLAELKRRIEADGHQLPESGEWIGRLTEAAEACKLQLSSDEVASVELPFLTPDISWSGKVRRRELEELARPVLEKTRGACLRALQDAGLRADEIDTVLLVGGQTRMPLVRGVVADLFGRKPDTSIDPDQAVVRGATLQAGILSGQVRHLALLDVTPLSLGVETFGGLMNVIIPRNSSIPCKAGELFTNALDFQKQMRITILQGERELAADNWRLGEVTVDFPPGARGQARVGVQFEIDQNGLLHVIARDVTTGHEEQLTVESAINVDDEEVETMVSDSVDHAFEDMEARRRIEAWTKAERLLQTALTALDQVGGELSSKQRNALDEAMAALKNLESSGGQ